MDAFGLYSVGREDITVFSLPSLSALLFHFHLGIIILHLDASNSSFPLQSVTTRARKKNVLKAIFSRQWPESQGVEAGIPLNY